MEGFVGLAVGGDLVVGCGEAAGRGNEDYGDEGRCDGLLAILEQNLTAPTWE